MAIHIDGSVIETKIGSHRDWFSDAEKIENVFSSIDGVEAVFSLVDDVVLCLESTSDPEGAGLPVVVKAMKYALFAGRDQLSKIRLAIDNTKSKTWAPQAHKKLTKADRMRAADQQLQCRTLSTTNPRHMFEFSINSTHDP